MRINCLSCGHKIDLDDAYSDYEGAIKCYACNTTLEIKLIDGNVKSVKFQERSGHVVTSAKKTKPLE